MSKGNTMGRVVGTPGTAPVPASEANPPVKAQTTAEAATGNKILDGVQVGLDVVGLIPGVGEVADLANAGISALRGDWVGAGLSLASAIPFAGWGAAAGKAGRRAVQAVSSEAAEKAAKEAAERAAREAALKAEKEAAAKAEKEAAEAAASGKDGGKVKPKKKLKCGDHGEYGKLKRMTGEGKFDRDHIPSKAALKARAKEMFGKLTPAQERAIERQANAIAIPRQAHIDVSPTYGQSAADAAKDAKNLAGAAERDVGEMLKKMDEYDAGCKDAYKNAAAKMLKDNAGYDNWLKDVVKGAGRR